MGIYSLYLKCNISIFNNKEQLYIYIYMQKYIDAQDLPIKRMLRGWSKPHKES